MIVIPVYQTLQGTAQVFSKPSHEWQDYGTDFMKEKTKLWGR